MKKTIDVGKLTEESIAKGVSVHLLVKRDIEYKKVKPRLKIMNCYNCKLVDIVLFDEKKRSQCHLIGIKNDFYADVDNNHICRFYKRSSRTLKEKELS